MGNPKACVCELINDKTKSWDVPLIRELFHHDDAELILKTPIGSNLPPDRRISRFTKAGLFTVKLAYHFVVSTYSPIALDRPSPSAIDGIWKRMWLIHVPLEVKHFIWRECTDSLPTRTNMASRGMPVDPVCGLCGEFQEMLLHTLFQCSVTSRTWYFYPLQIDMTDLNPL